MAAVISDHQFAKSQYNLAAAVTHRVLVRSNYCYSETESVDVEASLYDDSAVVKLRVPEPCRDPSIRICSSYRGFVFLAPERFGDITVWNPSTGAHRKIPVSDANWDDDRSVSTPYIKGLTLCAPGLLHGIIGIGYEESSDDYLIVIIQLRGPSIKVFSLKYNNLSSAKELWEKVEGLYQANGISNRLLLKEQFHNLRMDEGTKISDHLSTLNNIISELESIKVEIDDEGEAVSEKDVSLVLGDDGDLI
ncbi:uncharacterized protein LOC130719671 [Lotus japonicus]|uniref:uncharacterized protein LOC130719671 n=1 Tax=Lotus japonicus TaxID=34305 RepID=UPI0025898266|nr:uncharacterized protein LOC130719671 [Lotus japonicus]